MKGLLTVQEVADLKGISRQSVYQAIREGRLPAQKVLNRFAVKQKDADAYEPLPNDQRKGVKLVGRNTPRRKKQTEVGGVSDPPAENAHQEEPGGHVQRDYAAMLRAGRCM